MMAPSNWRLPLTMLLWTITTTAGAQDVSPEQLVAQEDAAIQAAVAQAAPWTVRIETLAGLEAVGKRLVTQGPTTGVAISPDGFIISSAFNFVQKPASILVTLSDGKRRPAKLIARDHSRKLVLLKVETEQALPVPEIVDRESLQVGQWAIGLGRTYGGTLPSVSAGIISAKHRIWGRAVQTDVKVSPANYGGPLIDLAGRLIGILVPLSPRQQSEVAGAEWYDSGIGFAVPLSDVMPQVERLKQGEDLHAGLLGISLKGKNIYADRAEIAAVAPKSPAADAGIRAGDVIVEVDGMPIQRQAQLKHALGPRYAGETLEVVVERGEKKDRQTLKATLAKEILPYAHAFLGVLLERQASADGPKIRFVYPESPAAQAGMETGDRLLKLGDQAIENIEQAHAALLPFEPGSQLKLAWRHGEKTVEKEVTLAEQPTTIPQSLPPAKLPSASGDDKIEVGLQELSIPEERNDCHIWLPESVKPGVPHGLLVWLAPAKEFDPESLEKEWGKWCRQYHFIIVSPRPKDSRWATTDVDFIHKAVSEAVSNYPVDETRVVIGGLQSAGAVGFLSAFPRRDLFHGVVAVDAPVPPRTTVPANEPTQRLSVLMVATEGTRSMPLIQRAVDALGKAKYPVVLLRRNQTSAKLSDEQKDQIIRWADTLDRL